MTMDNQFQLPEDLAAALGCLRLTDLSLTTWSLTKSSHGVSVKLNWKCHTKHRTPSYHKLNRQRLQDFYAAIKTQEINIDEPLCDRTETVETSHGSLVDSDSGLDSADSHSMNSESEVTSNSGIEPDSESAESVTDPSDGKYFKEDIACEQNTQDSSTSKRICVTAAVDTFHFVAGVPVMEPVPEYICPVPAHVPNTKALEIIDAFRDESQTPARYMLANDGRNTRVQHILRNSYMDTRISPPVDFYEYTCLFEDYLCLLFRAINAPSPIYKGEYLRDDSAFWAYQWDNSRWITSDILDPSTDEFQDINYFVMSHADQMKHSLLHSCVHILLMEQKDSQQNPDSS